MKQKKSRLYGTTIGLALIALATYLALTNGHNGEKVQTKQTTTLNSTKTPVKQRERVRPDMPTKTEGFRIETRVSMYDPNSTTSTKN